MKRASAIRVLVGAVVGFAMLLLLPGAVSRVAAQDNTLFPTPSGRYYNSYRYGPYGSSSQGYGGALSAGSPSMFSRGPAPPPVYNGPVNLYPNQPYGGRFYFRPMVGPAYDPFRNGR